MPNNDRRNILKRRSKKVAVVLGGAAAVGAAWYLTHSRTDVEPAVADDTVPRRESLNLPPGTRVECVDGTFSSAGGRQGACSGHGGVLESV